jgi:excisionase family DNA binding protein
MERFQMNDSSTNPVREGLSIAEACTMAGIGRTKIYQAISGGELVARKYGKRTLILRTDLQDFLSNLPTVQADG